jgi:hypothetical protein
MSGNNDYAACHHGACLTRFTGATRLFNSMRRQVRGYFVNMSFFVSTYAPACIL